MVFTIKDVLENLRLKIFGGATKEDPCEGSLLPSSINSPWKAFLLFQKDQLASTNRSNWKEDKLKYAHYSKLQKEPNPTPESLSNQSKALHMQFALEQYHIAWIISYFFYLQLQHLSSISNFFCFNILAHRRALWQARQRKTLILFGILTFQIFFHHSSTCFFCCTHLYRSSHLTNEQPR